MFKLFKFVIKFEINGTIAELTKVKIVNLTLKLKL